MWVGIKNSKPFKTSTHKHVAEAGSDIVIHVDNLELPLEAYIYDPETGQLKVDPNWTPTVKTIPNIPGITLEQARQIKLIELETTTQQYIGQYYPLWKQMSDEKDKDVYGSWLLTKVQDANGNPVYTVDGIYEQVRQYTEQIMSGTKTLSDILTEIQQNILPNVQPNPNTFSGTQTEFEQMFLKAWGQLIKAAVRSAFLQQVKEQYHQLRQQIEQATTVDELQTINININVPFLQI